MSWIFQAVALVTTLISSLSQDLTNGLSSYGTLECQRLPLYLGSTPSPWGKSDPASTNVPDTGAVRSYTFSISRAIKAPDGYQKSVILINGQFPGPLIEANWGDTIEVTVFNDIEDTAEGVTLHWHGQPQRLSPGEDGVPGVSQCPIPPGSSLTYRFRAEYFGTGWYHSHVSGQYTDGLYGPMVIYGPTQVPYDIDLGPIMLSDYSHTSYYDILKSAYLFPPVFPTIDNNLINGKGIFECSIANETICTPWAGLSKFAFQDGKVHRLRLINTGGEGSQKFSIDGHVLKVIANDYVSVEPYETDIVTLGIGQRTDVLVTASGAADGAYWMRSDIDEDCLNLTSVNSHALAAVYYPHSSTNAVPNTTATAWSSNNCQNDPLNQTIPYYPTTPPSQPATTAYVNITVGQNATGEFIFFINGTSFEVDYNAPLLPIAQSGNISQVPTARNLYDFGTNTSVRVVLENFWPTVHPIHLHGHNFWVLASGFGSWDGTIVNSDNPQRRDTHLMTPSAPDGTPSYLVVEFNTDNPGVWPMHCHTSIHASAGLLFNVLERSDLLQSQVSTSSMQDNCAAWAAWTSKDFVDQIDSGL